MPGWQSAECHPGTTNAECRPGTSGAQCPALRNFVSVVAKVTRNDFLSILGLKVSNFQNSDLETLWNFTLMVPKVPLQDFLPILGALRLKNTIRFFWPSCDQMVLLTSVRPKSMFGPFEVRPQVKRSKFWPGETSDLYANGVESFPPGFFTHFGRPTAKNYSFVLSTLKRVKNCREKLKPPLMQSSLQPECHITPDGSK